MDDIERTATAQKEEKVMLHEYEGIIISNEFIDIALVAFHKMKLVWLKLFSKVFYKGFIWYDERISVM